MKIKIDHTKCCGCKLCEVACSLSHTGAVNIQCSRIRVYIGEEFCLPVIAGPYTEAACNSKGVVMYEGHEVDECVVCRASCPVKSVFKEPDVGIPLKCDFCGDPPNPQCVLWCPAEALTLVDD
ncbi:4Fe-4S ferredoxin iron-sulfur binding domain protein [Desulfosarcina variabilis str. Montpellier]|uniref:4Fe-4S dicluster domain-containing protein n=1 Tax=Desulfosarcina variabilis TaxID=2300 RepID=UPI003AFAD58A